MVGCWCVGANWGWHAGAGMLKCLCVMRWCRCENADNKIGSAGAPKHKTQGKLLQRLALRAKICTLSSTPPLWRPTKHMPWIAIAVAGNQCVCGHSGLCVGYAWTYLRQSAPPSCGQPPSAVCCPETAILQNGVH